jgi:hypothetical protein
MTTPAAFFPFYSRMLKKSSSHKLGRPIRTFTPEV